jgi:dephospho-CoA kinase
MIIGDVEYNLYNSSSSWSKEKIKKMNNILKENNINVISEKYYNTLLKCNTYEEIDLFFENLNINSLVDRIYSIEMALGIDVEYSIKRYGAEKSEKDYIFRKYMMIQHLKDYI